MACTVGRSPPDRLFHQIDDFVAEILIDLTPRVNHATLLYYLSIGADKIVHLATNVATDSRRRPGIIILIRH